MLHLFERASGDDRAFWKGVRALRNRGSSGARMIALENGDLAPTPYAGRQRWQRHFAKLLCGEILPSSECVAAARQDYNARQIVEPEADLLPTMSEVIARFSRLRTGKAGRRSPRRRVISHLSARTCPNPAPCFCQGSVEIV